VIAEAQQFVQADGRLKDFILAGQANMFGFGP
jgi:hypothetical protein